jgi:hypothetical protein
MRYDLAAMASRAKPNRRKRAITIPDKAPPAMLAQSLFARAYRPMLERWNAAVPGIVAEYERTLAAMVRDSADDLQARLDAASSEMERLFILLDASIREWGLQAEKFTREAWAGAVLTATKVDVTMFIGPADFRETVSSYLKWNSELVRDVSAEIRRKISNAVFAGVQNRTPAREVAKEIREATGMSRRRALNIASDQASKLTSALAAERRREAGLSIYRFRHSGKKHPRADHLARNGKLYAEAKADAGREVDGQTVNEPIPEDQRAGRPPFCGCREQGVLIFD